MAVILSLIIGLGIGFILGVLLGMGVALYGVKQGWVEQDGYYYDRER